MAEAIRNPYLGPYAFSEADSDRFFGREEETRRLASLVVARRAVLVYARSGAGKTSLLKAGLVHRLRQQRKIRVLPITRVGRNPAATARLGTDNPFVLNLLFCLFGEGSLTKDPRNLELAVDIERYLRQIEKMEPTRPSLLIIDQLEELFTAPGYWEKQRRDLFEQLQRALDEIPGLSLLLSMREEFLARLEPFAPLLPDRLRARFRLELLSEEGARRAIREPALLAGAAFSEAALAALLEDLRTAPGEESGEPEGSSGGALEPVQLQVYCYRLWEQVSEARGGPPDSIGPEDLRRLGSIDHALRGYFAEQMRKVSTRRRVREGFLRQWIGRHLIGPQGYRTPILMGEVETEGLPKSAIHDLVAAHLVTTHSRRNTTWIELAHDRFISVIQTDNSEWIERNLSPLERQARQWHEQGRPSLLLLRGAAYREAEAWAARGKVELTPVERDFLAACRKARLGARRRLLALRLARKYTVQSFAFWALLIVGVVLAVNTRQDYIRLRQESAAWRLAFEALRIEGGDEDLALRLGIVSVDLSPNPNGRAILLRGLKGKEVDLMRPIAGAPGDLAVLDLAADGRALAGTAGGELLYWPDPGATPRRLAKGVSGPRRVALGPDGILALEAGGDLFLGNVRDGTSPEALAGGYEPPPKVLVFGPGGDSLAVALGDGSVQLWDVEDRRHQVLPAENAPGGALALAFDPRGERLAAGYADGTVRIWSLPTPSTPTDLESKYPHPIHALAFDPEGEALVTGRANGSTTRRDPAEGKEILEIEPEPATVLVAFAADLGTFVQTTGTGLLLFDLPTRERIGELPLPEAWRPRSLYLSHDGGRLAALGESGEAWLWDLDPESWKETACGVAERDLDRHEWQRYLTFEDFRIDYRTPCADLL